MFFKFDATYTKVSYGIELDLISGFKKDMHFLKLVIYLDFICIGVLLAYVSV